MFLGLDFGNSSAKALLKCAALPSWPWLWCLLSKTCPPVPPILTNFRFSIAGSASPARWT